MWTKFFSQSKPFLFLIITNGNELVKITFVSLLHWIDFQISILSFSIWWKLHLFLRPVTILRLLKVDEYQKLNFVWQNSFLCACFSVFLSLTSFCLTPKCWPNSFILLLMYWTKTERGESLNIFFNFSSLFHVFHVCLQLHSTLDIQPFVGVC